MTHIYHHHEHHFKTPRFVRDAVLGVADGLTVPFALAAGISGAIDATHIVIIAGLAEIAAGSISMGLGGYLSTQSEVEHYTREHEREHREVKDVPETEIAEVTGIFKSYGLSDADARSVAESFRTRPNQWVDFMMRFELGLERPHPGQARRSAVTIGAAYAIGGLIPLSPYMILAHTQDALMASSVLTLSALCIFGYIKGWYVSRHPFKSALQMTVIGGIAAAVAFAIARLIA